MYLPIATFRTKLVGELRRGDSDKSMKRGDGSEVQRTGGKAPIYGFHTLCFLLLNSEKGSVLERMCGQWSVASAWPERREGEKSVCVPCRR